MPTPEVIKSLPLLFKLKQTSFATMKNILNSSSFYIFLIFLSIEAPIIYALNYNILSLIMSGSANIILMAIMQLLRVSTKKKND